MGITPICGAGWWGWGWVKPIELTAGGLGWAGDLIGCLWVWRVGKARVLVMLPLPVQNPCCRPSPLRPFTQPTIVSVRHGCQSLVVDMKRKSG